MRCLRCELRRQYLLGRATQYFSPQSHLLLSSGLVFLSSGLVFRPLITELLQRAGHLLDYSLEETRAREAYALRHASRLPAVAAGAAEGKTKLGGGRCGSPCCSSRKLLALLVVSKIKEQLFFEFLPPPPSKYLQTFCA